jgi:DNA polymerase-3 subunit beta
METEQLNIEGKRSGAGFIAHRERLVQALSRAQAPKVEVIDIELGRKGLLNYLRLLGGTNIVRIVPSNGDASPSRMGRASGERVADKRLKVVCGSNTGYLEDGAWVTEKIKYEDICQLRVSPNSSIKPNLGGTELAEALSRVIPFAAKGDDRPVLGCIRFAQKDGKLTLTSADGFRLAEVSLDFEDGEGEVLVPAKELKGLTTALRKAKRANLSFENGGEGLDSKRLVIDTELMRYKWGGVNGTYPDYEKVIPTEFAAETRFDTRDMLRASASLGALFLDSDTAIIITIKNGMMTLSVKDDKGGVLPWKGEAQIEVQTEGEAITAVNGAYLRQALKALGGMAELKVKDPQSPMLFSIDGYRIVVMPVAIGLGKKDGEGKPEAVAEAEQAEAVAVAEAEEIVEPETVAEGEAEAQAEDKPKRKRKKEPVAVA